MELIAMLTVLLLMNGIDSYVNSIITDEWNCKYRAVDTNGNEKIKAFISCTRLYSPVELNFNFHMQHKISVYYVLEISIQNYIAVL